MKPTRQYLEGCVTLCEWRRERLRREAVDAKRRGDMREQSRVRRAIARNLEKKYRLEDMISKRGPKRAKGGDDGEFVG